MAHERTIAALAGPVLAAMGVTIIINRAALPDLARAVIADPALIVISGVLLLPAGIAILRAYNGWPADWRMLVTLTGWLLAISGLVRILFFRQLASFASGVVFDAWWLPVVAAMMIVIGGFLTFKGFERRAE